MKLNWLQRGDGHIRTVKPTEEALNLLVKVRDTLAQVGTFSKGMIGANGDDTQHCVLGWMATYSGFAANTYPNQAIEEGRATLRHCYPVAAALFAETVDGPGMVDPDGLSRQVDEEAVWIFNDSVDAIEVVDALNRTIRYAEYELGESA